jgi:hypothetical protein
MKNVVNNLINTLYFWNAKGVSEFNIIYVAVELRIPY